MSTRLTPEQTRAVELAKAAIDALDAGLKHVQLVLSRRRSGAEHMVVFQKPRLMGEVYCEGTDGKTVVWVDAVRLLEWLEASGLVMVKVKRSCEPRPLEE